MTEAEVNIKPNGSKDKTSYRRRSSIFQRRLSSYASDLTLTEHDDSRQKEESELTKYINDLKKEKLEWKKLFENLKKENNDYKERSCGVVDQTEQLELLTVEDKQFLQKRPDYVSVGRLLDQTKESVALRQHRVVTTCDKLHNLVQDCSNSVTDITEQVIWQNTYQLTEFHLHSQQLLDHLDHHKSSTSELALSVDENMLSF